MSEALIAGATATCGLLRVVVLNNFNVAIVDVAAAEGVDELGLAPDLAELVGRTQGPDCLLEVLNVARAGEEARVRGNRSGWIQAVHVPPQATYGARNNRAILSGTFATKVTQNGLVILVHDLEEVKILHLDSLLLPKAFVS
jgi:hypothetical protein